MSAASDASRHTLAGNPCPFLRALAEDGTISNTNESLGHISEIATEAFIPPVPQRRVRVAVFLIALIGNGLNPVQMLCNLRSGVRPSELRDGPLDKRGAGSRVLDATGTFVEAEFDRFDEFAVDCAVPTGMTERGLGAPQLEAMMDANFVRAAESRRRIDRKLMNGEWPVLLRVMGKPGVGGAYLSVAELRTLLLECRLPDRVKRRIAD